MLNAIVHYAKCVVTLPVEPFLWYRPWQNCRGRLVALAEYLNRPTIAIDKILALGMSEGLGRGSVLPWKPRSPHVDHRRRIRGVQLY